MKKDIILSLGKKTIILFMSTFILASCGGVKEQEPNVQFNSDVSQVEGKIQSLETVGADIFQTAIKSGDYTVIDLRTTGELIESGIIGEKVLQIDVYEDSKYLEKLQALDLDEKYAIYCRSGGRTGRIMSVMKKSGFENVIELEGGTGNWSRNGKVFVEFDDSKLIKQNK